MLGKGLKIYSILKKNCPRCQTGRFFKGHPYNLTKFGEVEEQCNHCNLKYSIETGFFQGSYDVSYALGVALFGVIFVLKVLLFPNLSYLFTIFLMMGLLLILSPLLFALSKIIWINFFVNFNHNYCKNKNNDSRT